MRAHTTERPDAEESDQRVSATETGPTASIAMLAGGALLVDALRQRRSRPLRAVVEATVGVGLLSAGRRRADPASQASSAEVHREVRSHSETDPRGTAGDHEVPAERDDETPSDRDDRTKPRVEPGPTPAEDRSFDEQLPEADDAERTAGDATDGDDQMFEDDYESESPAGEEMVAPADESDEERSDVDLADREEADERDETAD